LFPSKNIYKCKHLKSLGPEPLSEEFNTNYFYKYIFKKKTKVKDLLMDQKFVAGLGNIYCNEILFLCKINPNRIVKKINQKEILKLVKFTKKILKKSISKGGATIKNFSSTEGKNGNFQQTFNVYGREEGKCNKTKCFGVIKKIYTSHRSSFFCPRCQK